ncbi:unnamed protein product [Adineta steineri]|uniref:Dynein heavy chain ATP-binding dynein motor region domain-containing protein n=1 Tax=Adineta steineri TaxID=433720 RepID=A0A814ISA6_9BILA|nr:unnamed protein product [Adineta steineri]CAF1034208.1 unnamed protein product [Adineta steineri]
MITAEQQIRAYKSQTQLIVQLKRLLSEYELTEEKNLYKCLTIITDARKLIEQLDMKTLQELRLVTKAEKSVEDTLAAIIMILKSSTADITWQKGAIRQLANLYRFIKETQLFDKINLTQEHINLISAIINNFQLKNTSLYKWVKRVLQYHTVLLKKVRPIQQKYKEIEDDVLEQDQKLILLDNKKRISKIFETSVERQSRLNGTCAIASAFSIYLGPYTYGFRCLMLIVHWIECIRDRGMTIVFDQISSIKGPIINWQLDPIKEKLLQIFDEQKLFGGPEYLQMLFSLLKFLLGDQIYYEWLNDGVLPSEMENHTIIITSIEYPPLLIDPFGQYDQWMEKCYNLQKIHFDNQSKHDVAMSIEQPFLSDSEIYIKNCNTLDSVLYPLVQWTATSHESNSNDGR